MREAPNLLIPYQQAHQNPVPEPEPVQPMPENKTNPLIQCLFERQYQLIKHPSNLMYCLVGLGLIFLLLGGLTLWGALQVKSLSVQYAEMRKCTTTNLESQKCSVKFNVGQDMPGPVFLLYEVKNLYVNHRKFINSYSDDQLGGKVIDAEAAKKVCGNLVFNKNIPQTTSWGGQKLNPEDIASLCGVKPQGFFNDTFAIYQNGQKIAIDESKIYKGKKAIDSHRGPNSEATQWIDPQDQHFKLYMLDGSLLTKKRLWGVIDGGLKAGDYELQAVNNYEMASMKIFKGIQLTTATVMGGKNFFYPITFGLFFLLCLGFLIFMRIRFSGYEKLKNYNKQVN